MPNEWLSFASESIYAARTIRMYVQYVENIYMVLRFYADDCKELIQKYPIEHPDSNNENIFAYKKILLATRSENAVDET